MTEDVQFGADKFSDAQKISFRSRCGCIVQVENGT